MTRIARRFMSVAVLGAALFTAAACADPAQDPTGSQSPSPTPGKVTLADKKTTCDAYNTLADDSKTKLLPLVLSLQSGASDPVKALEALGKIKTLLGEYDTRLTAIAQQAGDAEVKAALDAELAVARKAKSDLEAAGVDQKKIEAVLDGMDTKPRDKLEQLCAVK